MVTSNIANRMEPQITDTMYSHAFKEVTLLDKVNTVVNISFV